MILVFTAILAGGAWHEVAVRQGIFFWMRAGWGLGGPLILFPMVWGTVISRRRGFAESRNGVEPDSHAFHETL